MTFMTKKETDARRVAVIGAGAAGMMAAITAAEAGAEPERLFLRDTAFFRKRSQD